LRFGILKYFPLRQVYPNIWSGKYPDGHTASHCYFAGFGSIAITMFVSEPISIVSPIASIELEPASDYLWHQP
jgi:hypothetical protein